MTGHRPIRRILVAAAAAWLASGLAAAQEENPPHPGESAVSSAWDALRKDAAARGIALSAVYDGEGLVNATGGIRTGAVYLGTLSLQLTIDAERLLGWRGMMLFINGLGTHGGHPSRLVGDAQGVSNLEAPGGGQLYEAWLQQNLFDDRFSALAGRYDLNSEFYRLQSAALFVNSSFGIGPEFSGSGRGGPSLFPDTSVGIRLAFKPSRDVVFRAAVLDGVPVDRPDGGLRLFANGDGLLLVVEAAFPSRSARQDRPSSRQFRIGRSADARAYEGKVAIGGWYYTASFDDLGERGPDGRPVRHRGSGGAYAIADELLHRGAERSSRQVHAFAQLGVGDSRVNRFGFYAGGGLVFSGLLPALENDELGLAVAVARNGSHFIDLQRENAVPVTGTETALELTYLFQIGKHVALQPDLQYVVRPGSDSARKGALAAALRFELSY